MQEVADISTRVSLTEGVVKLLANKRPARCRQLLEALFGDALKLQHDAEGTASTSQDKDSRLEEAEQIARRDGDLARRAFLLNTIASALVTRENRDLNRATEILN